MAAKTVFVFLYGGMVGGADRFLRPSHIYFFTEDQAKKTSDEDRLGGQGGRGNQWGGVVPLTVYASARQLA